MTIFSTTVMTFPAQNTIFREEMEDAERSGQAEDPWIYVTGSMILIRCPVQLTGRFS